MTIHARIRRYLTVFLVLCIGHDTRLEGRLEGEDGRKLERLLVDAWDTVVADVMPKLGLIDANPDTPRIEHRLA
jgi:hypothetical protein